MAATVRTFRNFDDAFAAAAIRKAGGARPYDLFILDMRMPGMNGLTGLRRMLDVSCGAPVAIISGTLSPAEARAVMQEGAAGFLPKTMPLAELTDALEILAAGGRYIPKFLMVGKETESVAPRAEKISGFGNLTAREHDVLMELIQGWSNKRIAEHLGIAEITVKSHLMHLFRKIGAKNRTDAVRLFVHAQSRLQPPEGAQFIPGP